jgi:hypothetical protein
MCSSSADRHGSQPVSHYTKICPIGAALIRAHRRTDGLDDAKGGFTHSMSCPCRAYAVPLPCRAPALFQQCIVLRESPRGSRKYPNCQSNSVTDCLFCSVLLPLFTVAGMDRCEENWYASDNKLRGTPRGSRKKPSAGR